MEEILHYRNEVPEKRFLVFSYPDYYPSGGLNDSFDDFDTVQEAIDSLKFEDCTYNKCVFDRIAGLEIDITKYGLEY